MARFCCFASHVSLLIVVEISLAIHIGIVSSSSPTSSPARYPEVEYVSTKYHPSSFESPPPVETEYDSLSPPAHPPLGISRSSESPPPETGGHSKAPISPTTTSASPEQPPLTSPLPSPPDEAPILPTPSPSLPSLPTEENVESSLKPSPEDEDSEADLWPDHQITSSWMPYKSSSSNRDADDSVVYERKPEKQPEEENEDGGEGKAGKGGVGFGVAMGVFMVGLGGLVYMKRRKGNDVRRTRSYTQLAERKSLI